MEAFAESHNPLNKLHTATTTAGANAATAADDDDEKLCHTCSHWDHRNCN
jgi:hypothetical protein